jgi:hypothetical protein
VGWEIDAQAKQGMAFGRGNKKGGRWATTKTMNSPTRLSVETGLITTFAAVFGGLPAGFDMPVPHAHKHARNRTLYGFGQINAVMNIAGAVPQAHRFARPDAEWKDGTDC